MNWENSPSPKRHSSFPKDLDAKGSAAIIAPLEDALAQARTAAQDNVDVVLRGNLTLTGKPKA